jgi:mannose-6-phosphate isomerase-like protein (cupin superfamily)
MKPEDTSHTPNDGGPWYAGTSGERIAVRLSSVETNGASALVESVAAPGGSPPLHFPHNEEEHFVVLEGVYRFVIEDKGLDAPVGTSVTVPRGARHSWRNVSDKPRHLLVILTPGGFEQSIQAIRSHPGEKMAEVAARYGCFMVGPSINA